ncbi:MAG TPA: RecQ family ATP-dependent DNA helicase, partial [Methanocorpusculum sp.]|nr:RecQ family ATP-dependent DNA helicase [Methanocorpusculum sp.]
MSGEADIQETLEKYFRLTTFRPNQSEIIEEIIRGRDVLAVMATGGGKSLCYQLPAVMLSGMTVVISPLISLMKDQVDSLSSQGVNVAMLNSSLSYDKRKAVESDIVSGKIRILYVSPERAVQADFVDLLQQTDVSLFAVDEAHCISMWGHQFRPEYRKIKGLRAFFPDTPFAAFTATATKRVRDDIVTELKMKNPAVFIGSFDRPNLHYTVIKEPHQELRMQHILEYVKANPDKSGIVYCFSRADTEKIADYLSKFRIPALPYHAGLSAR